MTSHIGIVACSAEGAALCYRTICTEGAELLGAHGHPEVSLHTHPLAAYMSRIYAADWPAVAELMLSSAERLAKCGADFLICPDNTIHEALPLVVARSPLPWLPIPLVVADSAVARGFRRVGLLGTRWLVESDVYPRELTARGLEYVRPAAAQRHEMSRLIMEELVYGRFLPATVGYFQQLIEALKHDGCDAVILGCTEIPLIISDGNSALPTLDSTRLLARAALHRACSAKPAVDDNRRRTSKALKPQRAPLTSEDPHWLPRDAVRLRSALTGCALTTDDAGG